MNRGNIGYWSGVGQLAQHWQFEQHDAIHEIPFFFDFTILWERSRSCVMEEKERVMSSSSSSYRIKDVLTLTSRERKIALTFCSLKGKEVTLAF